MDLPARSRFGEGKAEPLIDLIREPSNDRKSLLLRDHESSPDSLKEPHSKAFEAWAVSFCEAHPPITELEMFPGMCSVLPSTTGDRGVSPLQRREGEVGV